MATITSVTAARERLQQVLNGLGCNALKLRWDDEWAHAIKSLPDGPEKAAKLEQTLNFINHIIEELPNISGVEELKAENVKSSRDPMDTLSKVTAADLARDSEKFKHGA